MENTLNELELAIINEIIEFNKKEYSLIKKQLPYLRIKSRENTGVGMYIYFECSKEKLDLLYSNLNDICLSSDKSLELDTLKYNLNYELNITKGKLDFLELATNGESWNGNYKVYNFG